MDVAKQAPPEADLSYQCDLFRWIRLEKTSTFSQGIRHIVLGLLVSNHS